ncbi:FAD-dependent monooxygenase [Ramlibacter sp. Leaf400]|uniref:FAD-dependent monooxygenase n=1 Tax=Ramlibacter sp. Leaf400 TaxID=1736365 RepID=UPI0006FBD3EB|nr:FAD-dependent monooxygenase [Ramlibacter sp. Leaf400]KQT08769.1 FAD-dependent oxidoreductase [Ramlibacter sp. Leaf400]
MAHDILVAGGGIAGLAAAVGARAAGWEVRVFEKAAAFTEAGAGLQLGPNATRILREWRLLDRAVLRPYEPPRLSVRDAVDGRELGTLRLGTAARERYGAPYLTLHRADLHAALVDAAAEAGAHLHAGVAIARARVDGDLAQADLDGGTRVEADALAVADGVWSALRGQLVGDGPAPASGHVAYRAMLPMAQVPASLRLPDVQAWLGPRMHLVRYPVRDGEALNIVAFIEGRAEAGWDQAAGADALRSVARASCGELQALVEAVPHWRLWPVHDRPPLRSEDAMARGRAALLGDAAHPMRPYLAQGAGMALEDAFALQKVLAACDGRVLDVATCLRRYALDRWQRCARVQARSRRNGWIFHADGALRWARNLSMRAAGERLLDLPWLYGGR